MLDLPRMERIHLNPVPRFQKVVGSLLMANYGLAGVDVRLEGKENLPDEPVIFAMNHTDMYNYWPFQLRLWRQLDRFTSVWVKGKYYEHWLMGRFMEWANCIPAVSRGYLITRDFIECMGRRPETDEYHAMNNAVKAAIDPERGPDSDEAKVLDGIPEPILKTRRSMLGRDYDPARETYPTAVKALSERMNALFLQHNEDCFRKGLDLIIFPSGTRSIRLPRGHVGISQVALKYRKMVVPVGCNGSDLCYDRKVPFARGGEIVYRIGEPILYEEMAEFHIEDDFTPFTPEAELTHRDKLQGHVDVVMERINDLVDERYKFSEDGRSDGVSGSSRFV